MLNDDLVIYTKRYPEVDVGLNPQSGSFEENTTEINKSGYDDIPLDIEKDFEGVNLPFDETGIGEGTASFAESFDQSDVLGIVNDQIQNDFGEYLTEDAKSLDNNTVELKPGTEFDDISQYGYYDWYSGGKLVVNQDAGGTIETLVHEGLHMAADNGDETKTDGELIHHLGIEEVFLDTDSGEIQSVSNLGLNEGITEMFTRQSVENIGIDDISIAYPVEVEVAESLSDLVGEDVVKEAYFNSDVEGLRSSVDSKLGQGAFDTINNLMDNGAPYTAISIIENGLPADKENI